MLIRNHKRCYFIKTAAQWTWKSTPAKKCVITELPNGVALKMDGAKDATSPSPLIFRLKI